MSELFDVDGDHDGLDTRKVMDAAALAPAKEIRDGVAVGAARVRVPDARRENSRKRRAASGPAAAMIAGTVPKPAGTRTRFGRVL